MMKGKKMARTKLKTERSRKKLQQAKPAAPVIPPEAQAAWNECERIEAEVEASIIQCIAMMTLLEKRRLAMECGKIVADKLANEYRILLHAQLYDANGE